MYSFAGYTAENYELFRSLKKYKKDGFEILLAPCTCNSFLVILTIILTHFFYHNAGNQFGYQEPGDASAITAFAQKQSFDGNCFQSCCTCMLMILKQIETQIGNHY